MRTVLAAFVLGLAASAATPADYKAECGSCHVAYPPKLLPAESWRQLMGRLERHFGSDASLDAKTQAEIERTLIANAGRRAAPPGPEPRITQTRWFLKEHRGEIPPGKNPANCIACHAGAERGNYDDD